MLKSVKNNIGKFQHLVILFVWILIFAMPVMFGDLKEGINWNHIYKIWIEYTFVFILFLLNRFILLPKLFFKEKKVTFFLVLIGSFILLVVGSYYFGANSHFSPQEEIPPFGNQPMPFPPLPQMRPDFIPPFANLLILAILIVGFDTGLIISVKWIQLEQNKLQLEKENLETKMAFLQNQVSPHFFMNTLNNIHALVDISSEEAKDSIIKLSQMMGYMLHESQTEKISVQKEMEFIKNYVELMKIRFTEDINIELNIPENLPPVLIPPFLTISFIENAFKHGVSYEEPSSIYITFHFTNNRMYFEIKNTIQNKQSKKNNSGIGLVNTKNRLNLIFGSSYELLIEQLPQKIYSVKLNIPI